MKTATSITTNNKPTSIINRKPQTMSSLDDDFNKLVKSVFGSTHDLMGFDLLESGPFWAKETKYPPHDVVSLGENKYRIDIALAGFDRDDIDVSVTDDVLEISANTAESEDQSTDDYLHKGIAKRSFKQKFRMPQYGEVEDCGLTNGILSITITKKIPEEKLPKKVKIK
jgi:molecular chaperone IbpA